MLGDGGLSHACHACRDVTGNVQVGLSMNLLGTCYERSMHTLLTLSYHFMNTICTLYEHYMHAL